MVEKNDDNETAKPKPKPLVEDADAVEVEDEAGNVRIVKTTKDDRGNERVGPLGERLRPAHPTEKQLEEEKSKKS